MRSTVETALAGMLALAAALGIGRFVYTPILPFMVESLGLSKAQAGLIASANFLGYLAGALAATVSSLPGGRRAWLLGALAASAVTTAAMAATTLAVVWIALRFLGGAASAFVLVFSSALVLDRIVSSGRPALSGLHFAGVGIGIAISAVLVSGLAASGQDWRMLWVANGFLSLAALAAVTWLIPDETETPRPPLAASANLGPLDTRLLALIIAYGLFGFGYVITATFIAALVRAAPDAQALEPVVWIVVGVAAAPSVSLWTHFGRAIGNAHAFALACLVEAVGVAATALFPTTTGVLAGAILLGGTLMGITALGLVQARELARGDPRMTLGLLTAAFGLGQIIGPALAGVVADATQSFTMPLLASAAALLIAALFSLRGETRPWRASWPFS